MYSESIYRYLGREPNYHPTKMSIIGGMGPPREDIRFDEFDEEEDMAALTVIGGDNEIGGVDEISRADLASNDLRNLFRGGEDSDSESDEEVDEEIDTESDDSSDLISTTCPRNINTQKSQLTSESDTNIAAGVLEEAEELEEIVEEAEELLEEAEILGGDDTDLTDLFV